MEGGELLCNFRRCRRVLRGNSWVTFCSHIFCDEDGSQLLKIPSECRACGSKLNVKSDIVKVDLDPNEQFKSTVLAGLHPDIVMEVCHRAINFWSYQMEQERNFEQHISKRLRERLRDVQNYYEQQLRNRDDQIETLRRQLDGVRQDMEKLQEQKKISEELGEVNWQCQRLRSKYDSVRKKIGTSMVDNWNTNNAIIPAITAADTSTIPSHHPPPPPLSCPPASSTTYIHPTSLSSFRPIQLELSDVQLSTSCKIHHHRQHQGQPSISDMEIVPSDKGTHCCVPQYSTASENPDHQVVQCKHHQHSSPLDKRLQLHSSVNSKSNSLHPSSLNQAHPHPHPPLLPLPPPSTGVLNQALIPASSGDHSVPRDLPLQPISYDDFVFAPILHENKREGLSTSRRSSGINDRAVDGGPQH